MSASALLTTREFFETTTSSSATSSLPTEAAHRLLESVSVMRADRNYNTVKLSVRILPALVLAVIAVVAFTCLHIRYKRAARAAEEAHEHALRQQQARIEAQIKADQAQAEKRKQWYIDYLKRFTMTTTKEDFVTPLEEPESISDENQRDDLDDVDIELGESSCDDNNMDKNNSMMEQDTMNNTCLALPAAAGGGCHVVVDAHCAICLGEYQAGDEVVWSGLQCQHAFHKDCILPWIIQGRIHCPMCREKFVPHAPKNLDNANQDGVEKPEMEEDQEELQSSQHSQRTGPFSDSDDDDDRSQNGDDDVDFANDV